MSQTIAEMLVSVRADVGSALAGLDSASAAIETFQSTSAAASQGAGANVFDERVDARIKQIAQEYQALGQSETQAAESAQLLRSAVEQSVATDAAARLKQLAPAVEESAKKASVAGAIWSKFGAELSSIGKMAAGMATGMLAANLTMGVAARVQEAATQIDTYGKAVLRVQRITGESAESSSLLVAMFERWAPSVDEAIIRLARFERALAGQEDALEVASNGGKGAADYLRLFGVQVNDTTGHLRPTLEILLDLADGFQRSGDAAAKNGALTALFGRGSQDMILMLNQGRGGLREFMADMQKYGLVLSGDNVADVMAFVAAHKKLDLALQGVSLQMGTAFMPAVTNAAQAAARFGQMLNQLVLPAIRQIPGLMPALSAAVGVVLVAALVKAGVATLGFAKAMVVDVGSAIARLAIATGTLIARYAGVAAAATAAAAAQVAAWLTAAGPITLAIAGIALVAGAITLALSGKLGEAKDAIGSGLASVAEAAKNGWETVKKLSEPTAFAAGLDDGQQYAEGATQGVESAGVKAAKAASEAAKAQLQELQDAKSGRQLDFDMGHIGMETGALEAKLGETEAEGALIGLKRQMEDLDRNAVNYAQKRLELDQQDAVTRAKIAESALKANDEDLSYQQKLLKAELIASRHGGPPVDRTDIRQQLRSLHNEQLLLAPSLLVAEHNTSLAERSKTATDLTGSLAKNDFERQKLALQQAMAPFEAAATQAKRTAEDAQRMLDLEKQKFEIQEKGYAIDLLRAEVEAKKAEHNLYVAEHEGAQQPINVTVNVNNNGATAADHEAITSAVLKGVTQAAKDAKMSGPMVISPRLGGAGYTG